MHEPVSYVSLVNSMFSSIASYYFIHKFVHKYVKSKTSPFFKKSEALKLETISFQCYWVLRRLEDSTGSFLLCLLSLKSRINSYPGKKFTWKNEESMKHFHKFTLGRSDSHSSSLKSKLTEFLFGRTPQENGAVIYCVIYHHFSNYSQNASCSAITIICLIRSS